MSVSTAEKIAILERILEDVDSAYTRLFALGYNTLGNEQLGVAEGIERIIMDLEEEAGLV